MHTLSWDPRYEWKAVLLLSLGFGLVGIDRFMIMPMFPTIMKELSLGYGDLGLITGVLAIAWGIASLFMSSLSDRIGRRPVLIGSLITFSVLVGLSGLATGLGGLLIVRALMGFADGSYTPVSIAATIDASKSNRHGLNVGIQQMMFPVFGLAIAPILVTQLLSFMDWRWIFALVTVPGILLALAMYKILRNQKTEPSSTGGASLSFVHNWKAVLRHRNPRLLIVCMLAWLTCLIVTSAMFPSYLTDHLGLGLTEMGFVMSAIGFGAAAGCLILPAVSDRIGRKPVMVSSAILATVFLFALSHAGRDPVLLFALLFATHFFNFALITMTVGPLSAESVSPALIATSSGLVIGIGEIFGGGVAPIAAGYIAQHYGIENVLSVAIAVLLFGILATLGLQETAPRALARSAERLAAVL